MERCKNCEFDYCAVESKYGDMDCYAYIVDEKTKPYKQTLKEIKEIARVLANIYPPVPMKGMNALPFVNMILDKISEIENQ